MDLTSLSLAKSYADKLFKNLVDLRFQDDKTSYFSFMDNIHQCDLLIIDDLGTEMPGNFVTAALYSLVNDRLLKGKAMIISTNLNVEEMSRRYSPQIASRLHGGFNQLIFVGEDIRILKNRGF